jgi:tRNA-2-methylthio-N6-dimethylallyladenosine synthase
MNRKKYFIETFGCQMNEFDSERIRYILENQGYSMCESREKSDIIIINTCAVREKAKNRLYGHIGRLKDLKAKNPDLIICIGGCSAQNLKERIIKDFKFVDIVFGTHNISELSDLIDKVESGFKNICSVRDVESDYILENSKRSHDFKALIPISIGCNNYCSYCIVPYVRGQEKSLDHKIILKTIKKLVKKGVIEVTLLGQNVNSYGKDIRLDYIFSDLLSDIAEIKGLKRIRFMTSHPKDFSSDIIDVVRDKDNICNHIHLPLQSGSDNVLMLMNRKYSQKKYLEIIDNIRQKIPDCSITTDIIVGFPGEKREDFLQTLKILEDVRFNRAFTFIYSKREHTVAANMEDPVPEFQKKEWFNELLDLQNKITFEKNQELVGKRFKALVESITNNDMLEARLENNAVIILKDKKDLVGKIIDIEVVESKTFYSIGKKLEIE